MADDDINVGSAVVDLVPSAKGWIAKAKAQILPQAEELGREIGEALADQIADEVRTALTEGLAGSGAVAKAKGRESGQDFGGEFGRQAHLRIQAALRALPRAEIGVATNEAEQKLKDLRAELAMLGDKRIGVDISGEEALAEMARLQGELEALAANTVDIDVRVDTGKALAELVAFRSFAQAAGGVDLGSAGGSGAALASNLGKSAVSMGSLVGGGLILLSTLGPIAAAAGGIAAALAAPLGAATLGGVLFAGLGAAAVKDVEAVNDEIQKTKERAAELTEQAAELADRAAKAPTDASRRSLNDQRQRVLDEIAAITKDGKALEASLSESAKAYLAAKGELSEAFDTFLEGPAGDAVLGTIAQGLEVLADLLPEVEPLVVAVGDALSDALDNVDADSFGAWVDKLAELAGPAITDVIDILGDLGGALDAVLTMGSDTGESALGGIADAAERLNEYLRSPEGQEDLQNFFEWLATDGKDAGEALWDLAGALTDWFIAVEPLGSAVLDVTGGLAEMFSVLQAFNDFNWNLLSGDVEGGLSGLQDAAAGVASAFEPLGPIIRAPFITTFDALELLFDKMANFLDVVGKVPGFDWADEAAEKLRGAARGAGNVAENLRDIPRTTDPKITLDDKASAGINAIQNGLYRLSNGATVPINIKTTGVMPNLNDIFARKATGGPVIGPGTGTSDSIPTLLSNGEHVWTAAEVRAAGGHGALMAMRRAMLTSGPTGGAGAAASAAAGGMSRHELVDAVAQGTREGMDGALVTDPSTGRDLRMTTLLEG